MGTLKSKVIVLSLLRLAEEEMGFDGGKFKGLDGVETDLPARCGAGVPLGPSPRPPLHADAHT